MLFRIKWHISPDHYGFICMEITSKLNFLQQCQKSALICSIFGLWILDTSSSSPCRAKRMHFRHFRKTKYLRQKKWFLVAILNTALLLKILSEAFFLCRFTDPWKYSSKAHYPTPLHPQCQSKAQESTKMLFWLFLNFGKRCRVINEGYQKREVT